MSSDLPVRIDEGVRAAREPELSKQNLWTIIGASSAGTLIEWYDFYIFGALAVTISQVFFPEGAGATALLSTLATFAIGFVVRPFGAIVFGYLGDLIGRKYTFMVTLLLMGGATFLIGVLPGFAVIGWAAPVLLIVLRLAQGLALGGEYGGAATYVAENCPDGQRGYWTSWIQTTATLGLFVSLGVILVCRGMMSAEDFNAWGWRIPFWVSLGLVFFSWYIRRRMKESPLFQKMKASGKGAKNPLKESFGNWENLRMVLIALFGVTAGQGVVWYTGQFYAMNFTKVTLNIEPTQAEIIVGIALVLGTPFFIVTGWLSDRIGRKKIMLAGCLLGLLLYYPIYGAMAAAVDLKDETKFASPVAHSPVGKIDRIAGMPGSGVAEKVTSVQTSLTEYADGTKRTVTETRTETGGKTVETKKTTVKLGSLAGRPALTLIFLIFVQVLLVTLVYGPVAAFLVELFPTRIRYTSMSLPYHIGNGVFGGMVPFVGALLVERTGNMYAGLWYPMAVCALTLVVGALLVKERRDVKLADVK